jgi:large subunit ribosomal protein L13
MTTIIDANGVVLGRLSTNVAKRLLKGEEVAIINSEKAIIVGRKSSIKNIYKQKREVGTYRKGPFFPRMPDKIVKRTIRGMIPYQTSHGRMAYKKLKCYNGIPKDFEDKKIEIIDETKKKPSDYMTIEELSKFLGANISW